MNTTQQRVEIPQARTEASLWACPFCGKLKPTYNGTGSDVSCCGEVGHAERINFVWHSTPGLWGATRPDYDGAPDSHHPQGFGKTKEEAAADLTEQEVA